jgi:hypothetical protein
MNPKKVIDIPEAPQLPVPEQCSKCDGTRFRQEGDTFVCKACGTKNPSPRALPTGGGGKA